jgi:hypothetical protein
MSTSGFEVIFKVTSYPKGYLLVILSEGAGDVMADLNQNIEMTELKKSYKWCGKETCVC